jgi:hypothetical protein
MAPENRPVDLMTTWNQVAAFRLARHHLAGRAPAGSLVCVAGNVAGVQAQLLSAAHIGLWSRVHELRMADIEKAFSERTLVKAACMRQTQFLVPSEELAIFTRGSARRVDKEVRWARGKGVPDRDIDAAIDAALDALDQPRTRPEIAERVCRALGVQMQAVEGGVGWGSRKQVAAVPVGHINFPVVYLLHLVSTRGVYCSGPNQSSEPTFVRADAWIPGWKDITREQAETSLLRRYLHAFGPSTAADFALWSGMTLTEARAIWAREQSGIALVNVEGWSAEVLREDLEILAQSALDQPRVCLLPYFDTFLLGHCEREHLVAKEFQASIYKPQGWIAPVVLVDGRVAAVWESAREGNTLHINITQFQPLSPAIQARIGDEAQSLSQFLGTSAFDLKII